MSSFRINITQDDAQLNAAFERLIRSANDLQPLFASIGEYLIPEHEQRWEQGVDSEGQPWPDLAAKTWAKKRTSKILYEEGDLLRGAVYQANAQSLDFGITDFKAPFHHFGTRRGIPARELLGINAADEQEIMDLMSDYIAQTWKP